MSSVGLSSMNLNPFKANPNQQVNQSQPLNQISQSQPLAASQNIFEASTNPFKQQTAGNTVGLGPDLGARNVTNFGGKKGIATDIGIG